MKLRYLFVFVIICLAFSCKKKLEKIDVERKQVYLQGCIIGRDSDTLLLLKSHEDARHDIISQIPIQNWEFHHEFIPESNVRFSLVFKEEDNSGSWMPIEFFADADTIQFVLNDAKDVSQNIISGGTLNRTLQAYKTNIEFPANKNYKAIYRVFDSLLYDSIYSDAYKLVINKLKTAKNQEEKIPLYDELEYLKKNKLDKNELGKKIDSQIALVQKQHIEKRYEFINDNLDLASYSLLVDDIQALNYNPVPKEKIIEAINNFSPKFLNHPYTDLVENLWIGFTEMKAGGQYVNFSAPDINNRIYEFKPIVDNNSIVLLDLWATWCGPCIARSRLMLPIYEKYKDRGFEILGVAGEFKTLDRYKRFMAKEQWPWLNLIELDRQNKIWEKYNVMNGGGGMFLIDGSGEILAVDPTSQEVDSILTSKFSQKKLKL